MHKSSYLRMEYLVNYYEPIWRSDDAIPVKVLDIGSYDQNGTYRGIFSESNAIYTGLDMSMGPNVDIVPQDIYLWNEIENKTFDLVISGQVFEHIEYPWVTMNEIERILKPSGVCIIIAPNAGIEHKAPLDCYRFFSDGLQALARWAGLKVLHSSVAGVPYIEGTDEWVSEWNDSCLVAQKLPGSNLKLKDPFIFERRCMMGGIVSNIYKSWNIAVNENCKRFHNDKKYVLFGAGTIGEQILDIIGEENVYCFADNSADKQGQEIRGKKIISYDELKQISKGYNCLVTASYSVSVDIKQQLQKDDISCGTLFPDTDIV